MTDPLSERIDSVRRELIRNAAVASFRVLSESVAEGIGFYRVRALLRNGDLLEMVERFEYDRDCLIVNKYSFHWQDSAGHLICRWDNAPHHPEVPTFPHHLHGPDEATVHPHGPMDTFSVLHLIEERLNDHR